MVYSARFCPVRYPALALEEPVPTVEASQVMPAAVVRQFMELLSLAKRASTGGNQLEDRAMAVAARAASPSMVAWAA